MFLKYKNKQILRIFFIFANSFKHPHPLIMNLTHILPVGFFLIKKLNI
jgi:hypothetical protein